MADTEKCPHCGGETVNGICIYCGSNETVSSDYDDDDMMSIELPELSYLSDDEPLPEPVVTVPEPKPEPEEDVNPYANVVSYEEPEYGENYAPLPKNDFNVDMNNFDSADDASQTLTQQMKFKPEKSLKSYWWIILISLIVPPYVTWGIGAALNIFDEKNGKLAGKIILVIGVIKYLLYAYAS